MKKKLKSTLGKWSLLLLLAAYTVVIASWAIDKSCAERCAGVQVQVENNGPFSSSISSRSVCDELGRVGRSPGSYPLRSINTDSLERMLSRVNNFEQVECFINSAGKLEVDIIPMMPVARIFTSKGDSYYINCDGKRIDARYRYYADVPVVYGDFSEKRPATLVLPLVKKISSDSVAKSLVSMIEYRSPSNIFIIPRIRGHVVNLGDTSRLDEKFANLLLFYRKVMPYCGWNKYDTLSVKFRGQVVATRRDKSLASHAPQFSDEEDVEEIALQQQDFSTPASPETEPVETR